MRIAWFDPVGGASGDMIVASLLDAGLPRRYLEEQLDGLGLDGYHLEIFKTAPRQMASTRFIVHRDRSPREDHHAHQPQKPEHSHSHQNHQNTPGHQHRHSAASPHSHGRHLGDISEIINKSKLPDRVKQRALEVFHKLGEAEAKVHGTTLEEIHFHEVGAVDSIVDIVSACIGLEYFDIDTIITGPLPLSSGTVKCDHGEWPVPGPATMELLKDFQWRPTGIIGELVTPTAAAIFSALGQSAKQMPDAVFHHTGYGTGTHDYGIPNVLRVCIGTAVRPLAEMDFASRGQTVVIETNLDDLSPELLPPVMEKLLDAGARDVWFTPILMKKNRPGILVRALAEDSVKDALIRILLVETPTLGVRFWTADRICLNRVTREVETPWGMVRVKCAQLPEDDYKFAPEFEDVRKVAENARLPLRQVFAEVERLAGVALSDNPFKEADS